jgi:putative flippase GtrA
VKTLIRWGKFILVGAMGMAVQLTALAFLTRVTDGHYLCASAAAVELALMHNFVWHLHYTWRDRRDESTRATQFVRFHLSNGMISMVGNLLLMRMLVDKARMPVLAANVVAILCCSIANFCLGNNWTFAGQQKAEAL